MGAAIADVDAGARRFGNHVAKTCMTRHRPMKPAFVHV